MLSSFAPSTGQECRHCTLWRVVWPAGSSLPNNAQTPVTVWIDLVLTIAIMSRSPTICCSFSRRKVKTVKNQPRTCRVYCPNVTGYIFQRPTADLSSWTFTRYDNRCFKGEACVTCSCNAQLRTGEILCSDWRPIHVKKCSYGGKSFVNAYHIYRKILYGIFSIIRLVFRLDGNADIWWSAHKLQNKD